MRTCQVKPVAGTIAVVCRLPPVASIDTKGSEACGREERLSGI